VFRDAASDSDTVQHMWSERQSVLCHAYYAHVLLCSSAFRCVGCSCNVHASAASSASLLSCGSNM
jgi:hypothetical protein